MTASATRIIHCRTCLMPSSRPRVVFDETGQCNACKWLLGDYQRIDWAARRKEFEQVVDANRRHQTYDCIVPMSGGKDSGTIAYRLKHEMGLNPLAVCYGQMLWTEPGRHNFEQVSRAGIDCVYLRHNQAVSRQLARRFQLERGHVKQHYDAGVNATPVRMAVELGIPLIFYAEHGESFYGGLVLNEESRRTRDLVEVLEHQVGDDARNWATDGISERDLWPYIYPDVAEVRKTGLQAFYFSYFFPWDILNNALFARENMNFRRAFAAPIISELPGWWGRSDGSFEGFDSIDDMVDDLDFYMMFVKFGFGRATRMASRLIQMHHMTRDEGLALVRRFDGEFPRRYLAEILEYLDMSEDELRRSVEDHRNPELWTQENGKWSLRFPPC